MKSERRSCPRSARALQRPIAGNGDRTLESQCRACGQTVDTNVEPSLDRGETAPVLPSRLERESGTVAGKRPSQAVDLEKVLHFSQQLYAHALTLQELVRSEGKVTYEALRPHYDQQAAQQFEIFYHTLKRS